jgi:CheY-like chemotaxis protein
LQIENGRHTVSPLVHAMTSHVPTILLVEDDDVDAIAVERAFAKGNITSSLVVVRDGVEALERLRSGTIAIPRLAILLDLHMPRMGGIEFLMQLRSDAAFCGIPVVVLTTSSDDRDQMAAHRLAIAGYLPKPVALDALVSAMQMLERLCGDSYVA